MRGVCCVVIRDSAVYAVFADYKGMRVSRDNARCGKTPRHKLVVRCCHDVVGFPEYHRKKRPVEEYEVVWAEDWCFADAPVIF